MTEEQNSEPAKEPEKEAKKKRKSFRISSSVLAALMVAGVVAAWLGSGYLRDMKKAEALNQLDDILKPAAETKTELPRVKTRLSVATTTQPKILIRGGVIEAERSVTVRAEVGGKVVISSAQKEGSFVKKGTLLCGIAIGSRQAEKDEANAMMDLRALQLRSAKKLSKQGYSTQTSLAEARARYDAAKARLEHNKQALEKTSITAPYDGILEKVFADVGDFMNPGASCARIIDMEPLVISGNITEDEVVKIRQGHTGWALLPDKSKLTGFVRYIAHSSDPKTKTYRIELEAEANQNKTAAVREGITVQIHIPLEKVRAHSIPSSILTLNGEGTIGLRIVSKIGGKNIVQFKPIKIIEGNAKEYWVDGLPDEVNLIIVGQEYVKDGTEVSIRE